MIKITRIVSVLATLAVLGASGAVAGPLEGRWPLVEQTHGEGRANQADPARPLILEFVREGGRLTGRIGPPGDEPLRWPSLLTTAEEIRVESVVISADEDRAAEPPGWRIVADTSRYDTTFDDSCWRCAESGNLPAEDAYFLVTAHVDDVESPAGQTSDAVEIDRSQSTCR